MTSESDGERLFPQDNSIDNNPELYPDWLNELRAGYKAYRAVEGKSEHEIGSPSTKYGEMDKTAELKAQTQFYQFISEVGDFLPEAILIYKTPYDAPVDRGQSLIEAAQKKGGATGRLMEVAAGMVPILNPHSDWFLPKRNAVYKYYPYHDTEKSFDPTNPNFVGFDAIVE